jgi:hypothetical protein
MRWRGPNFRIWPKLCFKRSAVALLVPLVIIVAGSSPYVGFMVPAASDVHDESYQPLKTLRYFHKRGKDVHKWGTLPNFLYAPAFGAMMAYWHLTGDFQFPSDDFPYGFARPLEQIGSMIVTARAIVLLTGLIATYALAAVMVSVTRLPLISVAAFCTIFAASPGILHAFGSTKPDGLMIAFLALSMASYLWIIFNGLNSRAGVGLSLFAAAAVSCKELAAPAYLIPFAALLLDGLYRTARNPSDRRNFLRSFAITVVAGISGYAAINIVYAPETWLERMDIVLFGSLKDPEIWGHGALSVFTYDVLMSILRELGYVGSIIVLASAIISFASADRRVLLAWLPFLSFVATVFAIADYMPTRFMLPTAVLAVPPVAAILAVHRASIADYWTRYRSRRVPLALVLILITMECVTGVAASWADLRLNYEAIIERYLSTESPDAKVYPVTFYPRNPGSSRLSYLGYDVDDRALWQISDTRADPPDLIFITRLSLQFLEDFHQYPARAAYWQEGTGFDYRNFPGFEQMGYSIADCLEPELGPLAIAAFQPYTAERLTGSDVLVYRLKGN